MVHTTKVFKTMKMTHNFSNIFRSPQTFRLGNPQVCKVLGTAILLTLASNVSAQEGNDGYSFLSIPISAHSAALGGNNVSAVEDDATLIFTNPALSANVSDKTLTFGYTSYIGETSKLGASFVKQVGERGTWTAGAMMLNYGDMTETNANFEELGTFSAKDIDVQAGYTYLFNDYWSGGVQAKVLLSSYGEFSSTALGVDMGLNYYDPDRGWSLGLVAQNLGGQVDALYDKTQSLPFNLVVGVSKQLANAPIRLSFTMDEVTDWDKTPKLFDHMAIGADIFPSSTTWLAVGYNVRRAKEMKVGEDSHWAGLSLGAGLAIKKFQVGVAYGKYHVSASSLVLNASYAF